VPSSCAPVMLLVKSGKPRGSGGRAPGSSARPQVEYARTATKGAITERNVIPAQAGKRKKAKEKRKRQNRPAGSFPFFVFLRFLRPYSLECGIPAKESRDRLDNGLLIDVPGIPCRQPVFLLFASPVRAIILRRETPPTKLRRKGWSPLWAGRML
jgi:hypothetical protein